MKFAHAFQEHLERDGFPSDWVKCAISYRALKKCIKRVERELSDLGLDAGTLQEIIRLSGEQGGGSGISGENHSTSTFASSQPPQQRRPSTQQFQYLLDDLPPVDSAAGSASHHVALERGKGGDAPFHPKLLFAVDEVTGEPLHASLSPETKEYFQRLALSQRIARGSITELPEDAITNTNTNTHTDNDTCMTNEMEAANTSSGEDTSAPAPSSSSTFPPQESQSQRRWRMIEVPLKADHEFFSVLQSELTGLQAIQSHEQARFRAEIKTLTEAVSAAVQSKSAPSPPSSSSPSSTAMSIHSSSSSSSSSRAQRADLKKWRQIFDLYAQSDIFFSTSERSRGALDAAEAQRRLEKFAERLSSARDGHRKSLTQFHRKQSATALRLFLQLQGDLLRGLRFQEINRIALVKILKKFDKRTALGISKQPKTIPASLLGGASGTSSLVLDTEGMAKAVCCQISTELLPLIPRLDDYLCPVCFSIAFRPVRLKCQHVFCIRCLVVLQRGRENHCPMCRGEVVLEATSYDIDMKLQRFLKSTFPDEVRVKQRENQRAAGVDIYGPQFYDSKCVVM